MTKTLKNLIFAFGSINILFTIAIIWLDIVYGYIKISDKDFNILSFAMVFLLNLIIISNWIFVWKSTKYKDQIYVIDFTYINYFLQKTFLHKKSGYFR